MAPTRRPEPTRLSALGRAELSRRTLITRGLGLGALAVAAPSALSACGSSSSASGTTSSGGVTSLSYQMSWLPTVEQSGSFIADDQGLYQQNDLDVTLLNGGPNTSPDTMVVSGKALVGATQADSIAAAVTKGADVRIFGTRFQASPFCILSLAETPIADPRAMVGKRIGVAANNQTSFDLLLQLNSIDPGDVEVVPVQFDPAPVANKEVDGQVVFVINEPTQLEVKGIATHSFLFADHGYAIFSGAYFALAKTIEEQPEVLASFLRAERAGWEANLADPAVGTALTVDVYGKDQGFDRAQQQLESERLAQIMTSPYTEANGVLSLPPELVEANITTLAAAGIDVSADQLFTQAILDLV